MIFIALICPGLSFLLRGKILSGLIAIILQVVAFLTFIFAGFGFVLWLILAIWAIISNNNDKAERRHIELIETVQSLNSTTPIDLRSRNEKAFVIVGNNLVQAYNNNKSFYTFLIIIILVFIILFVYSCFN